MRRAGSISIFILLTLLLIDTTNLYSEDFFLIKSDIIRQSWRKIGFLYITPSLLLQEVGYYTNIYSYEQNENPDWAADLGADIKIASILSNRFILKINETPYYSYYKKNKKEEGFNNKFKGEVFTYMGNINIAYSYSYGKYKARPSTEFGARTVIKKLNHTLRFDIGKQGSINISAWLGFNRTGFEETDYLNEYNLSKSLDKTEKTAGTAISFPLFTKTSLSLNGEYFEYEFTNEEIRNGQGEKIFLELKFPKISIIKGSLSLGLKHFRPYKETADEYVKPYGSGSISIRLFSKIKFNLNYSVDNYYSFWQPDVYYDNRAISAGADYYPFHKIRLGYKIGFEKSRYKRISGEYLGRQDDITTSEFSIIFRLNKSDGLGLKYTFFRARSTLLDFDMNYSFIGGYLTHEF